MLFDSTLRRELARNFGGTLVVLMTIVLTILFIRTLGQAALGSVDPQDVALLLAYIALGNLPTMLAGSMFVSVVATLSRMYRASEMTIWFASGVSLQRFVRPVLQTSWPVLLLIAVLALFAWPWQNERVSQLKEVFERRSDLSRVAPGQFQSSGDGQRNEQDTGNGQKSLSRFASFRSLAGERVVDPREILPPKARPTMQLLREPSALNHGELVWRLGLVLAAGNMLLLGIGMSASNPRHASNWNLLFALFGFFAYYNFVNLTQAWVSAGRLGLGPALLATHGTALAMGIGLIWWREHGTSRVVMVRRRVRRRPATAAPDAA